MNICVTELMQVVSRAENCGAIGLEKSSVSA